MSANSTKRIGFLVPEFPGQTHTWIWREVEALRNWSLSITLLSTRRPSDRDRARHAFAASAEAETVYLWPPRFSVVLASLFWLPLAHPIGLLRCMGLCFTLHIEGRARALRLLSLILPAAALAWEARKRGLEHIHAHTCASGAILCMMVRRLVGIPFSMTLNANIDWWGGAMEEKCGEASFTAVISEWMLADLRMRYPRIGTTKSVLCRIGVDTRLWSPVPGKHPADQLRVVSVSRLHPSKGQDLLIRAVGKLERQGTRVSLTIVGDGPQRGELQALVQELDLRDLVRFMGSLSQEEIIGLMQQSDAFALASHAEPLGVAYMEAMSMELATIGTAAGGVGEIINDGVDGMLVPPRDVDALAGALGRLAADADLRLRLGRAGRATIQQRFDSRIGARTMFGCLAGHPPPS